MSEDPMKWESATEMLEKWARRCEALQARAERAEAGIERLEQIIAEQRDTIIGYEASCAEKGRVLEMLFYRHPPHPPLTEEEYNAIRAALSDTCGQRYRDIEEALQPFAKHAVDRCAQAPEWKDHDTVSIVVTIKDLREALAATEPTDEGGKP